MMIWLFLLSQAALVAFGLPAAFLPEARRFSLASRISCAYALGAVLLTLEGMLFTLAGWSWSYPALSIPLLIVSCAGAYFLWKRPAEPRAPIRISPAVAIASILICVTSVLVLTQSVISGKAIAVDFVIFWGIKAARFAHAGGIEIPFLTWVYATHTHANYPLLFPTSLAWFGLGRPDGLWSAAPFSAVIWFVAAIPLVFDLLRQRMADGAAAASTAFWSAALAAGLSHAFSGGNAESTLIFYETAALASLLLLPLRGWSSGILPGIFLAGAVLTKLEGTVAGGFILAGAALTFLLDGRREKLRPLMTAAAFPVVAGLCWLGFMVVNEIPMRDPTHVPFSGIVLEHFEAVLAAPILHSSFGTRGLSWVLPLAVIIVLSRRWRPTMVLPMTLATGLPLFALFHYLQSRTNPTELIGWTFSRLTLPALSAAILAASLLLLEEPKETGFDQATASSGNAEPS